MDCNERDDIKIASKKCNRLNSRKFPEHTSFITSTMNCASRKQNTHSFNEVSGSFSSSSSSESEESFEIVFNDDKPDSRLRLSSDCDSEDSFIVFEGPSDSCYSSEDVFGDESDDIPICDTDIVKSYDLSDCYDSSGDDSSDDDVFDSDDDEKSQELHRTNSDLDSNVSPSSSIDEVDCVMRSVDGFEICDIVKDLDVEPKNEGLPITDTMKLLQKRSTTKKVQFSTSRPKVHVMRVWAFAAQQARVGHWGRCAIDRHRFERRIGDVDSAVSWVLKPQHRSKIVDQRFEPFWEEQNLLEIAEKNAKEETKKRDNKSFEQSDLISGGNYIIGDSVSNGNLINDHFSDNGNTGIDENEAKVDFILVDKDESVTEI